MSQTHLTVLAKDVQENNGFVTPNQLGFPKTFAAEKRLQRS